MDSSALYPQYSPTSTKLLCLRVGVDARLSCVRAQDLAFLLKIVPWELEQFASAKLHLITLWNTSSMEQNTTQQVTLLTDKPGRWIIILNCSQLKLVKSIKINLPKKITHTEIQNTYYYYYYFSLKTNGCQITGHSRHHPTPPHVPEICILSRFSPSPSPLLPS